jgi:hypothetical protein
MCKPGTVVCDLLQERPCEICHNRNELMGAQRWRAESPVESTLQSLLEAAEGTERVSVSVRLQIKVPVSGVESESGTVATVATLQC